MVVVAHRDAMLAEAIATALQQHHEVVPIHVATSATGVANCGKRPDALILDRYLPGAQNLGRSFRAKGVRVVFLGKGSEDDFGVMVSTRAPIASLISAVAPGCTPNGGEHRRLTERERQVLALVGRGLAGKQVARHLGISPKTVEQHKSRIFTKLGVRNQAAAVSVAGSTGLGPRLSAPSSEMDATWMSSTI